MIEMVTDLTNEFKMQEEIDEIIYKRQKIESPESKRDELILAVIDEVCELMNKMRIHKFWSNKGMNAKEDLLEEYVDTWHFLLSIGNIIGVPQEHFGLEIRKTFTAQFRAVLFSVNDVFTPIGWNIVVMQWKGLGALLGFTEDEVREAFKKKHEINMERQANGY